ncbi:disulfide isomerase DsbC N-terminal domain-containing protein [Psychrobacter sp. I-STPA6b]|uniref:disulfide isomerase DsbC N-terminal domain-containing protein n=1 Tax=Psychrobacter sp. I-STPA6b TaxID=2585718 RepID=UPI001D0C33F4|nr:disulfide isomerase DsbC N-terminal domain-containing protein [Psychrobacter sp. I-STPA6b]
MSIKSTVIPLFAKRQHTPSKTLALSIKSVLVSALLMGGVSMTSHAVSPASVNHGNEIDGNVSVSESIDQTIRQTLSDAGIKVAILDITPSNLPNMYQVNLEGQPPLHITADGQYVIQGELRPNPSPIRATPPEEASSSLGSPVSNELRQALLANMSQLQNMNDTIPLYYTAVDGVIWGATGEGIPFLVSKDGKYFSEGEISVIKDGQFTGLDTEFEQRKNKDIFAKLDEAQLITYPAQGTPKATIYVATDIHCPYCRRLHRLIPQLNAKGVTVKTIGYPAYEESFEPMRQIWCEQDSTRRRQLFDQAMTHNPEQMALNHCTDSQTNLLMGNRDLSAGLAVFATPAIYREDGTLYDANFEHPEFLQFLGVE